MVIATMRSETITRMEINLDNLIHNYHELVRYAAPAEMVPVIKSEAYGHGAVPVARALQAAGCEHMAVAMVDEGIQLRRAGIQGQIMILGSVLSEQFPAMAKHDLTPVLPDAERIQAWANVAQAESRRFGYHIKVDVGLGRLGFMPEQAEEALSAAKSAPEIELLGISSHLSHAEGTPEHNAKEFARYESFVAPFLAEFPQVKRHLAASQAVLRHKHIFFDLVRVGGLLYGFQYDHPTTMELRPVLSYRTRITQVKMLPPGWGISYDLEHIVQEPTRVALLPLGWVDGIGSTHVGEAEFLVRGKFCKLVGICTDFSMLDVTHLPDVQVGDEVVLIGEQGGNTITAPQLGAMGKVSTSQLLGRASLRVARIFMANGQEQEELSILSS